jgi:hypothetical protein
MTSVARYVECEFYAEVCTSDGPTGEIVFVREAKLVDYGGNVIGGPFSDAGDALASQGRIRGLATKFKPVAGSVHRIDGKAPDGGVSCGFVDESEVCR